MKIGTSTLLGILLLTPLLLGSGTSVSSPGADNANTAAKLIALLFDMGRVVIGEHQSLINDEHKGKKGFTPEVFAKAVLEKFEHKSNLSWEHLQQESIPPQAKRLLPTLLSIQKEVVKQRQPIINMLGVGFKGVIPATFGTIVSLRFRHESGAYLKQTAPQVRNRRNTPDEYERDVLTRFADPSYPNGETLSETVESGKALRVMIPLYYGASCLVCHGEPKGEVDKTGHKKEGGRLGELGGAISVQLPIVTK